MTDNEKPGWTQPGTVTERCHNRSYIVSTPSGTFRRNRKHLKKVDPRVNKYVHTARDGVTDTQTDADTHVTENALPADVSVNYDSGQPQAPIVQNQTRSGRTISLPARYRD